MNKLQNFFKSSLLRNPSRPATRDLLAAWSGEPEMATARLAVENKITAVELAQRINKIRPR